MLCANKEYTCYIWQQRELAKYHPTLSPYLGARPSPSLYDRVVQRSAAWFYAREGACSASTAAVLLGMHEPKAHQRLKLMGAKQHSKMDRQALKKARKCCYSTRLITTKQWNALFCEHNLPSFKQQINMPLCMTRHSSSSQDKWLR